MGLLPTLTKRAEKTSDDSARKYRQIVAAVADRRDKKIDPDEAEAVLAELGKTHEDLERDAQMLCHRRELRKELREEPEIQAQIKQLEGRMNRMNEEYKAYRDKHNEEWKAAYDECEALRRSANRFHHIREQLATGCPDAELLDRERQLANEGRKLVEEHRELLEHRDRRTFEELHVQEIRSLEKEIERLNRCKVRNRADLIPGIQGKMNHRAAKHKSTCERLDAVEKRQAEIQQELEQIAAEKLAA